MTLSLAMALTSPAAFLPTALTSALSSNVSDSIISVDVTSPFDALVSTFTRSDGSSFVSPSYLDHAFTPQLCTPAFTAEMDVGWVRPWVGLGWLGSTAVTALRISHPPGPQQQTHRTPRLRRKTGETDRRTDGHRIVTEILPDTKRAV